jgi:hypothetical protein
MARLPLISARTTAFKKLLKKNLHIVFKIYGIGVSPQLSRQMNLSLNNLLSSYYDFKSEYFL